MSVGARLELIAVTGLPLVQPGDDLVRLLAQGLDDARMGLREGDVLVFAQKVVSKAEGRFVDLKQVVPSPRAQALAREVAKDARLVEVILSESRRIVRSRRDVLITEHRLGHVMANAGVDQSNVAGAASGEFALLLPQDPDASAQHLCVALSRHFGCTLGVVINDSFGRPWRRGSVGVAIGCAGVAALCDLRGRPDLFGRSLRVTEVGRADEIAAAASLLMGQADEGLPVVVVRGLAPPDEEMPATALIRPAAEDLFR
jgi:coenzyme F420-0:L-glutamate ligase/coenzyme F420-1:gamma-L-glutamate ligase